jgi:hypothetical protein
MLKKIGMSGILVLCLAAFACTGVSTVEGTKQAINGQWMPDIEASKAINHPLANNQGFQQRLATMMLALDMQKMTFTLLDSEDEYERDESTFTIVSEEPGHIVILVDDYFTLSLTIKGDVLTVMGTESDDRDNLVFIRRK